ncbi:MAG: hypothetical protein NZ694_08805, partial [Tepidimonas sp.]|nr:hypothetical protein [Tepidimonas sp.]
RFKIHRLARFGQRYAAHEIPDPYTGGPAAFEHALDLIEDAVDGWLHQLLAPQPPRTVLTSP